VSNPAIVAHPELPASNPWAVTVIRTVPVTGTVTLEIVLAVDVITSETGETAETVYGPTPPTSG